MGAAALPFLAADLGPRARRLGTLAGLVLLLAYLVRLYAQIRSFLEDEPFTWAAAKPIAFASRWGLGWRWQMATALLATLTFAFAPRPGRGGRWLPALAALAVPIAAPLTGHAAESHWGAAIGVAVQALHLLAGALWLGTLAAIALVGLPAARQLPEGERLRTVAVLIERFSPLALGSAAVVVLAGVALSYADLGSFRALVATSYGRALLIKLGLLAGMAAFGAYNWRRLRPRLHQPAAAAMLDRSVAVELIFGALLLAVTAVLVALPAPALE